MSVQIRNDNGEKYVFIARTVEKGIGKHWMEKTLLSIGLGCQVKYAKDFIYSYSLNFNVFEPTTTSSISHTTRPLLNFPKSRGRILNLVWNTYYSLL